MKDTRINTQDPNYCQVAEEPTWAHTRSQDQSVCLPGIMKQASSFWTFLEFVVTHLRGWKISSVAAHIRSRRMETKPMHAMSDVRIRDRLRYLVMSGKMMVKVSADTEPRKGNGPAFSNGAPDGLWLVCHKINYFCNKIIPDFTFVTKSRAFSNFWQIPGGDFFWKNKCGDMTLK